MKHFLRFRGCYCPKRIQPIYLIFITTLLLTVGGKEAFAQRSLSGTVVDTIDYGNRRLPRVISEYAKATGESARQDGQDSGRLPLFRYRVDTDSTFLGLRIGDSIPEALWNLPLRVVKHPGGLDTLNLAEYRSSKLLVLDFWAKWCKPCIRSMDKWEGYAFGSEGGVRLLGVHLDFDYKALPFIRQRNWKSPTVIGPEAHLLNRLFFTRDVVGRTAWVVDGRLLALTDGRDHGPEAVAAAMAGKAVEVVSNLDWTYGQRAACIWTTDRAEP